MDNEMLEAIRAIVTENNQKMSQMMDTKLAANNLALREEMSQMMDEKLENVKSEMSQMMDEKLEPLRVDVAGVKADVAEIKQQQADQAEFERGTRVIIENNVMPQIKLVAEQHGEIVAKLNHLEVRREASQVLRGRVATLEAVATTHTERIEALEARA